MKLLLAAAIFVSLVCPQQAYRNFFLDSRTGEGSTEDKNHRVDYLRVWDLVDLNFVEYPESGFTWVIDPTTHWNDDFFGVRENAVYYQEREHKTGLLAYYRKFQLEFYRPGQYTIVFIRVLASEVGRLVKLGGTSTISLSSPLIDKSYVMPVTISD